MKNLFTLMVIFIFSLSICSAQFPSWGGGVDLDEILFSKLPYFNRGVPTKTLLSYDDFLNSSYHDGGCVAGQSGTGAGESFITSTNSTAPGVSRYSTGTTATGRSGLATAVATFLPSGGSIYYRARVMLDTLSTTAAEYYAYSGLGNSLSGTPSTGMFFRYARPGATGGQWKCWTYNTSPSYADSSVSGISVVAGTWYILEIYYNGSILNYYINGNLVVTRSTNLPTQAMGIIPANIISSVGTKNKNMYIDYYYFQYDLSSNR